MVVVSTLEQMKLGKDSEPIMVATSTDNRIAAVALVRQGRRYLNIFSRDLDHALRTPRRSAADPIIPAILRRSDPVSFPRGNFWPRQFFNRGRDRGIYKYIFEL